jgi:jumonji domain-containing protein 2
LSNLDNLLQLCDYKVAGVTHPFGYFGMWKSTFSWHVEDMDLGSINVVHSGAPKLWYIVSSEHGKKLEELCRKMFPKRASTCQAFLRHKDILIGPKLLQEYEIPYTKIIQNAGEIVVGKLSQNLI